MKATLNRLLGNGHTASTEKKTQYDDRGRVVETFHEAFADEPLVLVITLGDGKRFAVRMGDSHECGGNMWFTDSLYPVVDAGSGESSTDLTKSLSDGLYVYGERVTFERAKVIRNGDNVAPVFDQYVISVREAFVHTMGLRLINDTDVEVASSLLCSLLDTLIKLFVEVGHSLIRVEGYKMIRLTRRLDKLSLHKLHFLLVYLFLQRRNELSESGSSDFFVTSEEERNCWELKVTSGFENTIFTKTVHVKFRPSEFWKVIRGC